MELFLPSLDLVLRANPFSATQADHFHARNAGFESIVFDDVFRRFLRHGQEAAAARVLTSVRSDSYDCHSWSSNPSVREPLISMAKPLVRGGKRSAGYQELRRDDDPSFPKADARRRSDLPVNQYLNRLSCFGKTRLIHGQPKFPTTGTRNVEG